jgi:hypothetical protein
MNTDGSPHPARRMTGDGRDDKLRIEATRNEFVRVEACLDWDGAAARLACARALAEPMTHRRCKRSCSAGVMRSWVQFGMVLKCSDYRSKRTACKA